MFMSCWIIDSKGPMNVLHGDRVTLNTRWSGAEIDRYSMHGYSIACDPSFVHLYE